MTAAQTRPSKVRLATVWLDGCSGCHMSLLDIDERLLELAERVSVVYGPLVDAKEFPENVDVTLVEGAVSSDEDLHRIRKIRARTKILVSLGDCAVTGNVPAMRNHFGGERGAAARLPRERHAGRADPAPGDSAAAGASCGRCTRSCRWMCSCPAARRSADLIFSVLSELLEGRMPNPAAKFG